MRLVLESKPDLLVTGSHGHRFLQDIILGTTVSGVRHRVRIVSPPVARTAAALLEAAYKVRGRVPSLCRARIRTLLLAQKQERSEREFIASLLARAKVNHEAAQTRPSDS